MQARPDDPTLQRAASTRLDSRSVRSIVVVVLLAVVAAWLGTRDDLSADSDALLTGVPAHPTDYGDDADLTFMDVQPQDPDLPVGYNPCTRVGVEINYTNASAGILDLTLTTIRQIDQASGLHLYYAGASQHYRRTQGATGRILISFNDIPHDGSLSEAAGNGGSFAYTTTPAGVTKYYVGGAVTLNTSEFNHYSRHDQALVLAHEMGHAVGLGHAPQRGQVMSSGDYSVTSWGKGDLTGLARLGRLPCA